MAPERGYTGATTHETIHVLLASEPVTVVPKMPFFSTKDVGMGMGLSIGRLIIAAHGGEIGHRPSRSGGSTFYFHLRAQQRAAAAG